ncbi:MAG: hypothetical protein RLZZ135_161 [Cyanobacteriota bacterium]|jgi:hypothetical protein
MYRNPILATAASRRASFDRMTQKRQTVQMLTLTGVSSILKKSSHPLSNFLIDDYVILSSCAHIRNHTGT